MGSSAPRLYPAFAALLLSFAATGCAMLDGGAGSDRSDPGAQGDASDALYRDARQLTFAGRRSGEGYFSRDGREIVFQSERERGNPFYQIYRMDLTTGRVRRISPGIGRTTCGWIHPDGVRTLFASTHLDPQAQAKQTREIEDREKGSTRRYAWGFDERYDLFLAGPGDALERLSETQGYDAEGAISPDGRWLVFASNRHAYEEPLSAEERERLAEDPSFFIDLYLMDLEQGGTRRLTTAPGYDGGPFFGPDGDRIVWRHFSEDGARAEIHSIRRDGTDERVLTRLGAMSWAPFYHPSGDYVVFTTNRHGYDNFELYLVDASGEREPVRVTEREGFDGLPVFSPTGDSLLWTSNRTVAGTSQLFRAHWNDAAARARLGLATTDSGAGADSLVLPRSTSPMIRETDLEAHVSALTSETTEGRLTGTSGELLAADYLARAMQSIGLEPAGDEGRFEHLFELTVGLSLGTMNQLLIHSESAPDTTIEPVRLEVETEWRPLAFSVNGEIEPAPVVFAGYGLIAPASDGREAVDDYAEVEVEGRWVMVFRDLPESVEGEERQHLQRYASLRHKSMVARDRGARGLLIVSGPRGRYRDELVPLRFDASLAGSSIAVVSIRDAVAERLLERADRRLDALQEEADSASGTAGFEIPDLRLAGQIDLITRRAQGRNVLGRLRVGDTPSPGYVVLGAHFDHLGRGTGSSSLAVGNEVGRIHPGADDNASGTALLLEIAEALAHQRDEGLLAGGHDLVFAAWSGEELGLIGSSRWVDDFVDPHAESEGPIAYLNFDMVGRMHESVVVQGIGSSDAWPALLEEAAAPLELRIHPQNDSYLPTDATSFFMHGVPILSAFTGVHSEYHTPRDVAQLLNLSGTAEIGELFARIGGALSEREQVPSYRAQEAPSGGQARSGFRVFLGTVPDYAQTDVQGVKLSGVAPEGPAEKAGIRGGDVIVEVDGRPIENLYDYTYALEALRVGEPARIVVLRGDERRVLEIVPASRD